MKVGQFPPLDIPRVFEPQVTAFAGFLDVPTVPTPTPTRGNLLRVYPNPCHTPAGVEQDSKVYHVPKVGHSKDQFCRWRVQVGGIIRRRGTSKNASRFTVTLDHAHKDHMVSVHTMYGNLHLDLGPMFRSQTGFKEPLLNR
jgi:hypothetical protein